MVRTQILVNRLGPITTVLAFFADGLYQSLVSYVTQASFCVQVVFIGEGNMYQCVHE